VTVYAELQITSNYSFLRGGSHIEELCAQAKLLGLPAIGITDRNTLAGIVRAHQRAEEVGIRLVIGCRLVLRDGLSVLVYPIDAWIFDEAQQDQKIPSVAAISVAAASLPSCTTAGKWVSSTPSRRYRCCREPTPGLVLSSTLYPPYRIATTIPPAWSPAGFAASAAPSAAHGLTAPPVIDATHLGPGRWFTLQCSKVDAQAFYQDVKSRVVAPEQCLVLPSIDIIIGETDAIARERQHYVNELVQAEAGTAQMSGHIAAVGSCSRHRPATLHGDTHVGAWHIRAVCARRCAGVAGGVLVIVLLALAVFLAWQNWPV
jgi:hypothetical protein